MLRSTSKYQVIYTVGDIGKAKLKWVVPFTQITNNPRRRNDDIRQAVRNEIKDFFKLLGVPGWKIEIKKIMVAESI